MKEERKDNSLVHLNELAEYLALNHVIMSLPDLDSKENKNSDIKKLLPNLQIDINDKSRNIFVFGAGVSFDAYPNIFKLGDETASQIEAKFEFNNIVNASKNRIKKLDNPIENTLLQRYNEIKTKLIKKYDKESLSFETRLALLSHFVGTQKIRSEISKMFNQRLLPPFFYSLSAHLLKSRFIDGIINFNFEELLDQAIEEELGIGQQNFVISDGNIKDYGDLLNEEKLVEPFYVKPHGTASHSSTLRFTKDHYIEIPEKIELLLNQLLLGKRIKTESGSSNKEPYHQFEILNLIVSGFALESIEFNNILEKTIANYNAEMNHKKELNIFFINKDKFQKKSDLENKIRERITKTLS